jgi:dTDP-4-amino-4,6-dideoxygalactose transaminase/nucleoside-diphosphate-sugar epimerase
MTTTFSQAAKRVAYPFFEEPVNVIVPEKLSSQDTKEVTNLVADMMTSGDCTVDYRVRDAEACLERHLRLAGRKLFLLSHGRIALLLALEALGVGDDERRNEVICPSFAYQAVLDVIRMRRLKPVFADVDGLTMNADKASILKAITDKTSAIILVDNYGLPNDYESIIKTIKAVDNSIQVIIDSAESFGASYKGAQVGGYGDAVALSFSFSKPLQCGKGGGLIVSDHIANRIRKGKLLEQNVWFKGCQLDPFRALALQLTLKNLVRNVALRNQVAAMYRDRLGQLPGISFQTIPEWATSAHTHFPIVIDENDFRMDRATLKWLLSTQNVYTKEYFAAQHRVCGGIPDETLPNSSHLSRNVLALPIGSSISAATARAICDLIQMFQRNAREFACLSVVKWTNKALLALESGEIEAASNFLEMTVRSCAFQGSTIWRDFYAEARRKIADGYSPASLKEFVGKYKDAEERTAEACGKSGDDLLTDLICACKLRRLGFRHLENRRCGSATALYASIVEKYKRANFPEMAECYSTIRHSIDRCFELGRNGKPGAMPGKRDENILVLGANGFVGRNLVAKIQNNGFGKITGVGLLSTHDCIANDMMQIQAEIHCASGSGLQFFDVDVRNVNALESILNDGNFGTIIILLPFSDIRFFEMEVAFSLSSMLGQGFIKIVEYAAKRRARLIQMSTAALYTSPDTAAKKESWNVNPFQNMYTEGKRIMEILAEISGIDVVTFRSANIFGIDDQPKRVIPNMIARAKEGRVLYANNETMQFIHVSDVVTAIEAAIRREIPAGLYNLGTDEEIKIRNLAEIIRESPAMKGKTSRSHVICPDVNGNYKIMDFSKIIGTNAWQGVVSLNKGLIEKIEGPRGT